MFWNYLKVALRNLLRYRASTFINVFGLAVGMACCILIVLWVESETGFDSFHENGDRIYRVTKTSEDGAGRESGLTSTLLASAARAEIPEVMEAVRFSPGGPRVIRLGDQRFQNDIVARVDPEVFNMFSFHLTVGDPAVVLADPFSVVLTETMKSKYFGAADPLGSVLNIADREFIVTGIVEDPPAKSHLQFDCLLNYDSRPDWLKKLTSDWSVSSEFTFVLLSEGSDAELVAGKTQAVFSSHVDSVRSTFHLQPLNELHLNAMEMRSGEQKAIGERQLYLFSALALLVLVVACLNFMNLATARSSTRAREIGLRKAVGAQRSNIAGQFLGETVLLATVAMLLAVVVAELVLPWFNIWIEKQLSLNLLSAAPVLLGLAVVVGLVSGAYPAFFLSSYKPSRMLSGTLTRGRSGARFRRIMVVSQFALAIFLMVGAAVFSIQLEFMISGSLGFEKSNVLSVSLERDVRANYDNIREELLRKPGVHRVTSGTPPVMLDWASSDIEWEGKEADQKVVAGRYNVNYDYFSTHGMEIIEGRAFSSEFGTDISAAFIVNETAVRKMGLVEPIGSRLKYEAREGAIVGVVKDFHFYSLRDSIPPLVIQMDPSETSYMSVKLDDEQKAKVLAWMEEKWTALAPDGFFEALFLDEEVDRFYQSERQLKTLVDWAMGLAVLVACLGLLGLTSFTVDRRSREIGIRRVLGASITSIVRLLTREVVIFVMVAAAVAWPLAYFVMDRWLQDFAYRIDIGLSVLLLAGLAALSIAGLTVSVLAIRAARANPVDSLKCE